MHENMSQKNQHISKLNLYLFYVINKYHSNIYSYRLKSNRYYFEFKANRHIKIR